jgi:hypothetical protein
MENLSTSTTRARKRKKWNHLKVHDKSTESNKSRCWAEEKSLGKIEAKKYEISVIRRIS